MKKADQNNKDDSIFKKRHSVRKFTNAPVEPEKIAKVLKDGLLAPSHNHFREWHFILIKDTAVRNEIYEKTNAFHKSSEKLVEKTLQELQMMNPSQAMYAYASPLQKSMLLNSPELLLVCYKMTKPLSECATLYALNNFASVWMVAENILLSMVEEGLYGVTMVPYKTDLLKELLKVPTDMEIATFIPFGYPDLKEIKLAQVDVPLEDCLHINRW